MAKYDLRNASGDDMLNRSFECCTNEKSRIPLAIRTTPFRRSISNLSRSQISPISEYDDVQVVFDGRMYESPCGSVSLVGRRSNEQLDRTTMPADTSSSANQTPNNYANIVTLNGTTFSGKKMKYLIHCPNMSTENGQYLTPTQRAQKEVRVLKKMLFEARKELLHKDSDILRLTNEVTQLRSTRRAIEPDMVTSDETAADNRSEPAMLRSACSDSGAYDDFAQSLSLSSKFSSINLHQTFEKGTSVSADRHVDDDDADDDLDTAAGGDDNNNSNSNDRVVSRNQLIAMYEKKLDELIENNVREKQELRLRQNDRIEELLMKLTDLNTRYSDLVPDYNKAKEKIRFLEQQLNDLNAQLEKENDRLQKFGTEMYSKGLRIGKMEGAHQKMGESSTDDQELEQVHEPLQVSSLLNQLERTQSELNNLQNPNPSKCSSKSSILLNTKNAISLWVLGAKKVAYDRLIEAQKPVSKIDPEVTLKFLKSAIYYYLTDENSYDGHLRAIENILGFSEREKETISKCRNRV